MTSAGRFGRCPHFATILVKPEPETAFVDPITGEDYTRDQRNIARKAEAYLKSTGLADIGKIWTR